MGTKDTEEFNRGKYYVKKAKAELANLEPEVIEDLAFSAELELSTRDEMEHEELIIKLTDIADAIDEEEKTWGKVSGLSTGFPKLDARIGGLKDGELILIGGKPKNGKSALAQNIAVNASHQAPVLFITLELLARQTGVRMKHINKGEIPSSVFVQSKHRIDYKHIKPMFEQAVKRGVRLVVLDYMQFLGRGMTNEEVAKMSKEMKTLALEFEIPFIVIVSLRKGDTKFKTKWTDLELDDIMGTSAIGYDADCIMVASRIDPDGDFAPDHMFVKIVAVRSMPDSDELLAFNWDKTRITEDKEYDWMPERGKVKEMTPEEYDKLHRLPYKN